ncbi:hypothetical protein Esti_006650 [Eimeria stiedai]
MATIATERREWSCLQGLIRHGQSLFSNAAATEVQITPSKTEARGSDPVIQSTARAVCQTAMRRKQEMVPSSADTQHLPQQVSKVGREQSEVPFESASWFAALSKAFIVFLDLFISVCERLFFVVPLAFVAAIAGFRLVALPYVLAGLWLVGVSKSRIFRWDAAAEHKLKEVIFTAITAAASAAGPTYVKFFFHLDSSDGLIYVQWTATRPDLFTESLCTRCAKYETYRFAALASRLCCRPSTELSGDSLRSPVGCGCIAQVYRVYLSLSDGNDRDSLSRFLEHTFVLGDEESTSIPISEHVGDSIPVAVTVKVMRPGVRESMVRWGIFLYLRVMSLLASAVQRLPAFGFVAIEESKQVDGSLHTSLTCHCFVKCLIASSPTILSMKIPPPLFLVYAALVLYIPTVQCNGKSAYHLQLRRSSECRSVEKFGIAVRRRLDFSLEEERIKRFRKNFGLSSPHFSHDMLPLRNKFRRVGEADPLAFLPQEVSAHRHKASILGMLEELQNAAASGFPVSFRSSQQQRSANADSRGRFYPESASQRAKALQEAERRTFGMGELSGGTELKQAAKCNRAIPELANPPSCVAESLMQKYRDDLPPLIFPDGFPGRLFMEKCTVATCSVDMLAAVLKQCVLTMQLILPVVLTPSTVHPPPRPKGQLELVFLDCGLAASLSQRDRVNFVTVLEAIGKKHGRDAAIAMLRKARLSACKDEEKFCSEVGQLVNEHHFEGWSTVGSEEIDSPCLRHLSSTSAAGCGVSIAGHFFCFGCTVGNSVTV